MERVGVVLCGSGRLDGSEVHESVLTLLHLVRGGARPICFAPDAPQWAVCDHLSGEVVPGESRNQLHEAARIARGEVQPLTEARVEDLDALVLPGGSGAARNLCDFAERGADGAVLPELAALIRGVVDAGKPLGAICIAPALVALALKGRSPRLTLGPVDGDAAREVARTGAEVVPAGADEVVADARLKLWSTPAYIVGRDVAEVDVGIGRLVASVLAALRGATLEA